MSPISTDTSMLETVSCGGGSRRFRNLRGVRWRIDLGILPSSPSASIDDLRRVTANSRRRYAALRRQLLVDPHLPKDGSSSPDVVIDNPLSQSPDSMWGRFFRNAELERMVDQDLTRLYPERGSYFQSGGCQGMLRRILLLWCLRHPEYGYRQGMHELLAPLLYVLHVDAEHLLEVRKSYDDQFADKFDGFSFHENDLTYKFDFKKFESEDDGNGFENSAVKPTSLDELDPEIQTIVLLSDAYGAEGELGIVLSEKFMEHDAFSMFDALMNGAGGGGAVAMAEFFAPSPFASSHTGYPPIIEASAALYHLLSIVDSSLHSHLVELGVEPQYFALRWLRVLFGREFSLEDLLVIWDEIFSHENMKSYKSIDNEVESNFVILESHRGAFICAFAVSIILNLRSSLLATENATACLQRLLNLPDDIKVEKLLTKGKSLHSVAVDANSSSSLPIHPLLYDGKKMAVVRGHSLSLDSISPRTPLNVVPDSYWEEKWRVLHKEEEKKKGTEEQVPTRKKGWSEKVRMRLSRTESDPSPTTKNVRSKIPKPAVRRSLLKDLEQQLGLDEDAESKGCDEDITCNPDTVEEVNGHDVAQNHSDNTSSATRSEENLSSFSDPTSPIHGNSSDNENESGRSSVASNSLIGENDAECSGTKPECFTPPVSDPLDAHLPKCIDNDDSAAGKLVKERKLLSGKFQWLWKLGRNNGEGSSAPEACNGISNGWDNISKGETTVDQNSMMHSLKSLGQSMRDNIQVLESVFQQDQVQTGGSLVGKGQVTAMAALKELRNISNLLSEM